MHLTPLLTPQNIDYAVCEGENRGYRLGPKFSWLSRLQQNTALGMK
jgi:hypothetical protein